MDVLSYLFFHKFQHAVAQLADPGKAFHPDTLLPQPLAAGLKRLLNGDAAAHQGGAGLIDQIDQYFLLTMISFTLPWVKLTTVVE